MNDFGKMAMAGHPGLRLIARAGFALLFLCLAQQGAAFAADGERWIRFAGDYGKVNALHPRSGISNTNSLQLSNPEDNSAKRETTFQAAEDLVFDRLIYTQWDLPLDSGDASASNDGDQCLYARSHDVDPGPSELFCIPTYTTTVAPLPAGDPEAAGKRGVAHEVDFPTESGLFFPKGATFTCPNHLNRTMGEKFSPDQLGRARWSCRVEYHVASPGETVGRIARIPYLDTMPRPGPGGQLIDPSMVWLRGWDGGEPLVVTGFLVYASTQGVQPGSGRTRSYQDVCINKVEAQSLKVLQRECVPNFSYGSDRNAPTRDSPSGFIKLKQPIELSAGERLTASCETSEPFRTDCGFFVLYEVPPKRRVPTVGDYYWDLGQFDSSMISANGPYCASNNLEMLTPAGKQVLRAVARYHDGQWSNTSCAEDDLACACRSLYKPFGNGGGK